MEDYVRKEPMDGDNLYFSPLVSQETLAFEDNQKDEDNREETLPPPANPFQLEDLGQEPSEYHEGD